MRSSLPAWAARSSAWEAAGVDDLDLGVKALKKHLERVAQQIVIVGEQNTHGRRIRDRLDDVSV